VLRHSRHIQPDTERLSARRVLAGATNPRQGYATAPIAAQWPSLGGAPGSAITLRKAAIPCINRAQWHQDSTFFVHKNSRKAIFLTETLSFWNDTKSHLLI
jgi:hypothetical protein